MRFIVPIALALAGVIHLLPLPGVLGGERLALLYGVSIDEPNLLLLMRHRAVLFGLVGAFMLWAAWQPPWHAPALIFGLVSVVSFLALAALAGDVNPSIRRVVVADIVALAGLVIGGVAHVAQRASSG
jgi:hypothetical protein